MPPPAVFVLAGSGEDSAQKCFREKCDLKGGGNMDEKENLISKEEEIWMR